MNLDFFARKVKSLERAEERNRQEHKEIFEQMQAIQAENDALRQLCRSLQEKVNTLMLIMEQIESIQEEVEEAAEAAAEAAEEATEAAAEIKEEQDSENDKEQEEEQDSEQGSTPEQIEEGEEEEGENLAA